MLYILAGKFLPSLYNLYKLICLMIGALKWDVVNVTFENTDSKRDLGFIVYHLEQF